MHITYNEHYSLSSYQEAISSLESSLLTSMLNQAYYPFEQTAAIKSSPMLLRYFLPSGKLFEYLQDCIPLHRLHQSSQYFCGFSPECVNDSIPCHLRTALFEPLNGCIQLYSEYQQDPYSDPDPIPQVSLSRHGSPLDWSLTARMYFMTSRAPAFPLTARPYTQGL